MLHAPQLTETADPGTEEGVLAAPGTSEPHVRGDASPPHPGEALRVCGWEAAPRALCATGSEEPSALTLLETRMQTSWPSDPTARRGPP